MHGHSNTKNNLNFIRAIKIKDVKDNWCQALF